MTAAIEDVFPSPVALAQGVARWIIGLARAKQDRVAIALSGGSTPRLLYQTLATQPCLGSFPWQRVHWFWGDERFVPHSDPESNYRMASEAMLAHAPVPRDHIHPIPTIGVTPQESAKAYAHELKAFHGAVSRDATRTLFDIVLLGLGEDGHTASLFPGTPALDERDHWTAVAEKDGQARITLTYPALESCAHAAFLVSGTSKRDMLARMRRGDTTLPAARYRPRGELRIFSDSEAAGCAG